MKLVDFFPYLNFALPLVLIGLFAYLYRLTHRYGAIAMMLPCIYMAVIYGIYIYNLHIDPQFQYRSLQIEIRLLLTLFAISLIVYVISEILSIKANINAADRFVK